MNKEHFEQILDNINKNQKRYKEMGEIIKEVRTTNKLTQKEMAEKLGVGRTTVVGYEKGTIQPSLEVVDKFCNEFNYPMYQIMNVNVSDKEEIITDLNDMIIKINNGTYAHNGSELGVPYRMLIINSINALIKNIEDLEGALY